MIDKPLRIVADENIPALENLLPDNCEVRYLPGREIQAHDLMHADALLVRSITQVNSALLSASRLQFVGSCTIGTDHIDRDYLHNHNISFANAPGCNADAVVDYVLAAMFSYHADFNHWQGKTAGIVGLGQVGSRLSKRLTDMGLTVLAYDPFVEAATACYEDVLAADIVSFHVPITHDGDYPTKHMLAEHTLAQLKPGALLINSCRGQVFDNQALQAFILGQSLQKNPVYIVLDVYEDEPCPGIDFLNSLDVATAHIAGYSEQGKIRGSLQVVEALRKHFQLAAVEVDCLALTIQSLSIANTANSGAFILAAYDIEADSQRFISTYSAADNTQEARARCFDLFRKNYPVRTEFSFLQLPIPSVNAASKQLKALGFQC